MEFKNYANELVKVKGCLSCAFSKGEFILPCGMAYKDELFTLAQDFELPIPGFLVIAPKRHVENFSELTEEERIKMFELINKTIKILKENHICERFNVIFEEKEGRHFHVWMMPRYKWMEEVAGSITKNIGEVFAYAKENFRIKEIYEEIQKISNLIRGNL